MTKSFTSFNKLRPIQGEDCSILLASQIKWRTYHIMRTASYPHARASTKCAHLSLDVRIVQNDIQQRTVNFDVAL